jgi:sugar O-acyltransferase (sialic acid O-acetyltransferase NeuD family)
MTLSRNLIIVGDGEFAEIAYEYFTADSEFTIVAFAVEREYLKRESLYDLPVVALENVEERYPPSAHQAHVAVTYTKLNRVRARLCQIAKQKGYLLANFVSPRAFVWKNVQLGENVFIFENNVLQHHVKIGDGVVLWSGNHVGHRSVVGNYCFISSHVVIPGYCQIGDHTFMGVNSTLADNIIVGRDNWIGPNTTILGNTQDNQLYGAIQTEPSKVPTTRFFRIKE